jgi:hypothetical protein
MFHGLLENFDFGGTAVRFSSRSAQENRGKSNPRARNRVNCFIWETLAATVDSQNEKMNKLATCSFFTDPDSLV